MHDCVANVILTLKKYFQIQNKLIWRFWSSKSSSCYPNRERECQARSQTQSRRRSRRLPVENKLMRKAVCKIKNQMIRKRISMKISCSPHLSRRYPDQLAATLLWIYGLNNNILWIIITLLSWVLLAGGNYQEKVRRNCSEETSFNIQGMYVICIRYCKLWSQQRNN